MELSFRALAQSSTHPDCYSRSVALADDRFDLPPQAPPPGEQAEMAPPGAGDAPEEASAAARVLRRHTPELLAIEGVEGVAVGRTATGEEAIVAYLHEAAAAARVPAQIDGYPVLTTVTGPIDAQSA
jgi:hypothetical protein